MAASRVNSFLAGTLLCAALWTGTPVRGQDDQSKQPISLKTDSYEVDFRSGKTIMRNVPLPQGAVSITAQRAEATGLNFDDSRWEFTGDVVVKAEQRGNMRSDRAVVEFRNNRIARATVKGAPA